MTKWKLITHWLGRIFSLGLLPGRCFTCGSWMRKEEVFYPGGSIESCIDIVCPKCEEKKWELQLQFV